MDGSITVFGGTGFIGRHLVPLLLRSGATVRVAVRHPGRVQLTTESAQQRNTSKPMCLTTSLSALQSQQRMPSSISSAF
jgi:nucleoside-diphosphate-sugar epimerase